MSEKSNNRSLSDSLLDYKEKLSNETLTQQAYLTIRKAIYQLELKPNESFLEREMAEMLKMSRTPVHSALIRLDMDGWGTIIPRKGFTVAPIEAQSIKEISQITEVLDGVAVELAVDCITEEELNYLDSLVVEQEKALLSENLNKYVEIDHQFHDYINERSGNDTLLRILNSYTDQLFRARLYTIDERLLPVHSIREHEAILAALRAKSGSAARNLMEIHRRRGNLEIINIIHEKSKTKKKKRLNEDSLYTVPPQPVLF